MVSSLLLVFVFLVAVTSQPAGSCGGEDGKVIAVQHRESDGSVVTVDGRRYPAGCSWESRDAITRGCESLVTCLWKCCPEGQVLNSKSKCTPNKHTFRTRFNISKFHILTGFSCLAQRYRIDDKELSSIEQNGTLIEQFTETGEINFYSAGYFCLDTVENGTLLQTVALFCESTDQVDTMESDDRRDDITLLIYTIARLIALPFLIATVAIYAAIPELMNLHGKCLVSHVTSLTLAYVFLIVITLGGSGLANWSSSFCISSALIVYFFLLGSFFWLNVMCFDIWWTFSGHRHMIGRKGANEQKEFFFYSLYAWGAPVIMLSVCVIIEFSPSVPDSFIKPELGVLKCWFKDKLTVLAYFGGPVGFIILSNIVFFAVTALNILRIKRQTSVLSTSDSRRNNQNKNNEQRFMLYLKLFVVMGVTWSLDQIGWAIGGPDYFWWVTDLANILQGVLIFIIFVCKARVWKLLKQRFHCDQPQTTSSPTVSTAVLESSLVTMTSPIVGEVVQR